MSTSSSSAKTSALRVMAGVSMLKGLYHWSRVCGMGVIPATCFNYHSIAWQTATIFFAVIDLVAAVGLWLAAAWGAVIWLILAVASMLAVEIFFPQVFGASLLVGLLEGGLLVFYLWLALKSGPGAAGVMCKEWEIWMRFCRSCGSF